MDKPTLVFVHGYLGGSLQWSKQVDFFGKKFNVIVPDLPGYGLNKGFQSPPTICDYASYVIEELDKAAVEGFHLVGHSMGGMIAQEIVARVPRRVHKLILYATGASGVMPGRFETIETSKTLLMAHGVEKTASRIVSKWFVNGVDSHAYRECLNIAIQTNPQAAAAGLDAMQKWSKIDCLSHIQSETLILWGQEDRSYLWGSIEELFKTIPGASLVVFADCSHAVHMERVEMFNFIIDKFLR